MPRSSSALQATMADKAASPEPASGAKTPGQMIIEQRARIAQALPKHLEIDRFLRLILTEMRETPKLHECSFESLMSAVMQSAQLGLEPGPLDEVYLIPRYNSRARSMEANFQIGYRGYLTLFNRAGVAVTAEKVCENDDFDFFRDETGPRLRHRPLWKGERGPAYLYYCQAVLPGGQSIVHAMTLEDIARHRKMSATPDAGPWRDHPEAMAKKTVILDAARYIPKSIEIHNAFATDMTYRDADALIVPPDSVQPSVEFTDTAALDAGSSDQGWETDDTVGGDTDPKETLIQ